MRSLYSVVGAAVRITVYNGVPGANRVLSTFITDCKGVPGRECDGKYTLAKQLIRITLQAGDSTLTHILVCEVEHLCEGLALAWCRQDISYVN